MAKFKQTLKKIDAEQLLEDTDITWEDNTVSKYKAGVWVLSENGIPFTTMHDIVFQNSFEEDEQ